MGTARRLGERIVSSSPWWTIGGALVPFAVAAGVLVVVVGGDLHPVHDIAQLELVVRDVGHHEVALGPYSRNGWFHPGPAVFYLLAVPYRLSGSASASLYVGALLVNAGSVAGMAWIARRRGGTALMVVTLVCAALLVRALGPDFVRDPWNPSITVLPFGLLLFLAWAMSCGERWALPAAVAVGSFVAQTHVGYVLLAGALLMWGTAWLVATERGRVVRPALVAAGILALMWAPPLAQQFAGEPANLGAIVDWFQSPDEPLHTVADGWRVLSTQLGAQPEWLFGRATAALSGEPIVLYDGARLPLALLVVGPAVWLLWRQGTRDARRLVLTLGLTAAVGIVAVARTPGLAFEYRLAWVQVLGMTSGVVVGWAAVVALRGSRLREQVPRLVPAALAGLAVVTAVNVVDAAGAGEPELTSSELVGDVSVDLVAALPSGDGPVLVESPTFTSGLYSLGVALDLERHGVPVELPSWGLPATGEHRWNRGGPHRARVVVAVDGDIRIMRHDPGLRLFAQVGTIPPPRPPDDPALRAGAAFLAGDTETVQALARRYGDDLGPADRVLGHASAVAVFIEG